jgi:ABC-2 type transport system permease protein
MTPFPSMVQLPIDVFVGYSSGAELAGTLAMQLGWAAVLFSACYAMFLRGTQRLVVQGG